jgi:predicted SAM-dependent methyltransferase
MRYHLGCGGVRLPGYVNVDLAETPATDLVTDLTEFRPPEPADSVLSSAFFEHLRRFARVPHLASVREALTEDGFVCYLRLPDFERVAQLYLERAPGVVGPRFDLFNVYRLTHGDPEMAEDDDGWYGQLHKSLFDVPEVTRLLEEAGFPSFVVFRHAFPPDGVDLSLGFYATRRRRSAEELREVCLRFLADFDGRFVDLATLSFVDERSRTQPVARALASRPRRLLRRVTYALADKLARA